MLHHLPPSIHKDPFHFSSSSPERQTSPSYVAIRHSPYTLKSSNAHYYTSLRSTAQSNAVQQQPSITHVKVSTKSSGLLHLHSIDSLYTSAEAATRSPRCSSKPQTSLDRHSPLPTMVKSKPHAIKALALNAELEAAKRNASMKSSSAAPGKKHRNVVEAAKQHSKLVTTTLKSTLPSKARQRSLSPALSPLSTLPPPSKTIGTSRAPLQLPRIIVRSPTPEPEESLEPTSDDASKKIYGGDMNEPLYRRSLMIGLDADIQNAAQGIDSILSKYFDLGKRALHICVELLRYLASSMCRLYSLIDDPDSDLGVAKARAVSSHLFQHLVTGFFHLLDDPLAPYSTASSLALVSAKILQDFDKAAEHCCSALNVPSRVLHSFSHSKLFLNVLNDELNKILERGIALTDQQNKLALPGKGSPIFQSFGCEQGSEDNDFLSLPFVGAREDREKVRKAWAREGHENDQFVGIDVVRLLGELALHKVLEIPFLAKWLERFFVQTVYPDIPSAWEVECGCALLITIGPMLESKADVDRSSTSGEDSSAEPTLPRSDSSEAEGHDVGTAILARVMKRIKFLVAEADISNSAREWLTEVQLLRNQGWQRDNESDSSQDLLV